MSDAAFRFLSWVRRGAATQIQVQDTAAGAARALIPVEVAFNAGAHVASLGLTLQGPGDVIAVDPRAVVRAWPPPGTLDAEPNYFPLVELDQVDLPWRYTPRAAHSTGRLRPWLSLIVLRDDEHTYEGPRAERPLGAVTIATGTPMPWIDQAWAWSHVQISGDDGAPLTDALAQPGRCVARVLAARRLDPSTTYWAMLVPIFEVGRRAGLRVPLAGTSGTLGPAWSTAPDGKLAAPLQLPVYYRWRFGTGVGGDFESLVRQLVPRPLSPTVGLRALDASRPGAGLPAASVAAMSLGGALAGPTTAPAAWPTAERAAFIAALGGLLDLPTDVKASGGTPVVAPPLYGAWHARRDRLSAPPWFQHLNEDPRSRIAAALGTQVVQTDQHALMESAWLQVAGIREVNDQLRRAQLARAISARLHARYLAPATVDALLAFSGPSLGHFRFGTKTVRALTANSPPRLALVSSALRRIFRPLGPLGRRQGRPDQIPAPIIDRINGGSYANVLSETPRAPVDLTTHQWLREQHVPWNGPPSANAIASQPPRSNVVVWDPILGRPPGSDPGPAGQDSPSMARFRTAAFAHAGRPLTPEGGGTLRRLNLNALRARVVESLDPAVSIPAGFGPRLIRNPGFAWNPPDPIEPVMAHPVFTQPMYVPLAAISQDWVLPGLADVQPNSVALAVTNPPFIEAYMVGLNHEMSRELLWNEYPTDQRGSYFRQFWDPAGLAPVPIPETAKDIQPIHEWPVGSDLGQHSPRPAPPDPSRRHVVLLVRGEVLRRYPGTLVYAQRAQGPVGARTLAAEQRAPVFAGRLPPDVSFFGFDLSVDQARGVGGDPGWFFVFQEQPAEPRFGLDVSAPAGPPASWNDLAWTHVAPTPEALAQIGYIDLGAALPPTAALELPGGAAWHLVAAGPGQPFARGADHAAITLQRPVRVAVHATEMLP
ncbi:MAG: hypothetical protein KIT31_03840 [Deltaproteobacteria bacterium]|nr:hypothetical protein [Deltaproteobacteria bacterium]